MRFIHYVSNRSNNIEYYRSDLIKMYFIYISFWNCIFSSFLIIKYFIRLYPTCLHESDNLYAERLIIIFISNCFRFKTIALYRNNLKLKNDYISRIEDSAIEL